MSLSSQVSALATRIATEFKTLRGEVMVSPLRYGAAGDLTTDDTTAVQSAFSSGRPVLIDRPYLVGGLTASTGLTVVGAAGGLLKRKPTSNYTISINSGSGGSADPATNVRDVQFIGLTFDDDVANNVFRQGDAQLNLNACSDVLVTGCRFLGFRSDAIYLGSSNTAATERHNQRVKIVGNWFDGVNNDNRNAVSIIDGEDVLIQGNSVVNCTRSNMPGAIDCEPNIANTFAVLRNITIANNIFRGVGGTAGVICLWLPIAQTALTTSMRNITIFGNVITECGNPQAIFLQQSQTVTTTTPANNFEFFGNTVSGLTRPFELGGLRGVRIHDNTFTDTTGGAAYGYSYKCRDVVVNNNVFTRVASTSGVINEIYNVDVAEFSRNTYSDIGLTDGTYGVLHKLAVGSSTGATTFIDASNNRITGTGYTNFEEKSASHTTTASLNYAGGNRRVNLTGNTNTEITPSASVWAATASSSGVPTTRTISTTAPLTGGGDLSANRTLAITTGTTSGTVALGDHTHSPATPATQTGVTGAATVNCQTNNGHALTLSGDVTGLTVSGTPYDGQRLLVELYASGGARTFTTTLTNLTSRTFPLSIPSGSVRLVGLYYSSRSAAWAVAAVSSP